ncbi:MAG TPA: tRNA uracil 4-sulfurtransferase ThiI [Clostridiales bacterium]|nr:tRNA uracil 4-sulfurtransferase ThiI [Clostridiales bacterium]
MYKLLLLRYGELGLKGKNKGQFIKRLEANIRRALPHKEVLNTWGRLWVPLDGDMEETVAALSAVFGLYSVSPVIQCGRDLEEIAAAAKTVLETALPQGGTFKIESRRSDKTFPLTSPELSQTVGGMVLPQMGKEYTVDVREPRQRIDIEVRKEGIYVFGQTIPMAGGLPVGSSGKGVVMLSGGIDSPVCAYLAMKRGVKVDLLHFHSFPYTSERAKEKVVDLASVLAKYSNAGMKLHVIHFTDIQMAIRETCREEYTITMMRRFMYRIAQRVAASLDAKAIFTGESVGQVASQTLESMYAINEAITMPVLRPLCCFDKEEIIAIAQKIGTFDISIRPYEDCCTIFLPDFPKIRPDLKDCLEMEAGMDVDGLIEAALAKSYVLHIKKET